MGRQWTVGKQADGGWRRMLSGTVVDGEVGGWWMVDDGKRADGGPADGEAGGQWMADDGK